MNRSKKPKKSADLQIDLTGTTENDIFEALDEAVRLIKEGFTSGFNSNDDGGFIFTLKNNGV